ncbi:MAG: hypothetical protein A2Z34_08105 [Planctomycetes bacterium RBG_16_59_8]|nr:MAG: hypothetical protein A2Z34_08105 [Planctomycetes bacterium RBG_16_59_8]
MGDRKAFGEMVEETKYFVFNILFSHVRDAAVAEDLSQETYLKAFSSLNGLKNPNKINSWLASIAHHTAIDWMRAKKNATQPSIAEEPADRRTPVQALSHRERETVVRDIVNTLPPRERELIVLRYMEALSYKEIAALLKMTATAVGEKLCRLRRRLEAEILQHKEDIL